MNAPGTHRRSRPWETRAGRLRLQSAHRFTASQEAMARCVAGHRGHVHLGPGLGHRTQRRTMVILANTTQLDWNLLVWDSLGWFGMVWDGLGWFGVVWGGLGWFGMGLGGLDMVDLPSYHAR